MADMRGIFVCYNGAMLDFRAVLLAVTAMGDIGAIFFTYFRRQRSTNITLFVLFLLSIVCWSMLWFYYFVGTPFLSLLSLRLTYDAALAIALTFYLFSIAFPSNSLPGRSHLVALVGVTAALATYLAAPGMLVVSTSFSASSIAVMLAPAGYLLFTFAFVAFYVVSMVRLLMKLLRAGLSGEAHAQLLAILVSATLVGLLGIYVDLILGSPYLHNFNYLWTGPLFTSVIAVTIIYSVFQYRLFNTRVVASELFVFLVWALTFVRTLLSANPTDEALNGALFVLLVAVGLLLVRSVNRTVQQQDEIERLSAEKSEFMSFASHEIRNPITAMRGYASLIADGTVGEASPQAKDSAQKILVNGDTVLSLISEFLNKSKLELGQISYAVADVDVGKVVNSIAEGMRAHAEQKGLSLAIRIVDANLVARADEAKLREVVGNLIDNSVKYTQKGAIMVEVEKRNGTARIVVSDTGVGIPPETISHLFQKFSRADAQKMNLRGTGLGLYLAKTFIEGMGGKIWAESGGKNRGSRFIVELPAA